MLEIRNLTKVYRPKSGVPVVALDKVNLTLEDRGMVFILGKSGSGKSTFLNCLGGLDRYDSGEIIIKGKSSKNFSQSDFDSYRNTYLGFIFQEYNILNEFSVGKNIMLAMELQGKKSTHKELDELMEKVDLKGYANRRPNELSGGQKQRVAIARALIKEPEIIMADEPTGALDSNTGRQVFETLKKLSEEKLVLIVSHDREYAEYYGDRVIEFADGKIISDITKYKSESEKINGLNIIDNRIIHIKKGYKLVPQDLNIINNCINAGNEDTIISVDSRSNREFKRLARIDEDGNKESFKDTTIEDVKNKSSKDNRFKLIKSRFSLGNAIKMGASGLKVKPIRLFFTILLCVIAFTLFGVSDALGAYNKTTATVSSIRDSKVNYVSMVKREKNDDNGYSFYRDLNMNDSDIEMLSEKFNQEFMGVVSIGNNSIYDFNFKDIDKLSSNTYWTYYERSFSGFLGADENKLANLGYQLVAGEYPKNDDEVAVTVYTYEHFKAAGWGDPISQDSTKSIDITNYDNLKNKTILINNEFFTITGIVDTKLDSSRYESLKASNMDSSVGNYLLIEEFREIMDSGPHSLAFVTEDTAKDMVAKDVIYVGGGNMYDLRYEIINEYNSYGNIQSFRSLESLSDPYYFFDGRTSSLKDNEIILPFRTVCDIYQEIYREINNKFGNLPYWYWDTDPSIIQNEFNNLNGKMGVVKIIVYDYSYYSKEPIEIQKEIAGWYYGTDIEEESYIISDAYLTSTALSDLSLDSNPYAYAISAMPSSNDLLRKIVEFNYEDKNLVYNLTNSVMSTINQINSIN